MAGDTVSGPVSGEILAGRTARGGDRSQSDRDIVEAEYETVIGRHGRQGRPTDSAEESESSPFSLNILSDSDQAERNRKGGPAFWLVGAVLIAAAFWISGGHTLVSASTIQLASKPSSPLTIIDVRSRMERRGSQPYLVVEGMVANDSAANQTLPDLIIQVRAGDETITRYRIAGGDEEIVAGGRYAFSSRLGSPASGVKDVKVMIQD